MADYQPGAVKRNSETDAVAIKTAPNVTAGEWFVFDPENGGHYADASECAEWPNLESVG